MLRTVLQRLSCPFYVHGTTKGYLVRYLSSLTCFRHSLLLNIRWESVKPTVRFSESGSRSLSLAFGKVFAQHSASTEGSSSGSDALSSGNRSDKGKKPMAWWNPQTEENTFEMTVSTQSGSAGASTSRTTDSGLGTMSYEMTRNDER